MEWHSRGDPKHLVGLASHAFESESTPTGECGDRFRERHVGLCRPPISGGRRPATPPRQSRPMGARRFRRRPRPSAQATTRGRRGNRRAARERRSRRLCMGRFRMCRLCHRSLGSGGARVAHRLACRARQGRRLHRSQLLADVAYKSVVATSERLALGSPTPRNRARGPHAWTRTSRASRRLRRPLPARW